VFLKGMKRIMATKEDMKIFVDNKKVLLDLLDAKYIEFDKYITQRGNNEILFKLNIDKHPKADMLKRMIEKPAATEEEEKTDEYYLIYETTQYKNFKKPNGFVSCIAVKRGNKIYPYDKTVSFLFTLMNDIEYPERNTLQIKADKFFAECYDWLKTKIRNKIEKDLLKIIPKEYYYDVNHLLVWHGRKICNARNPRCEDCPINEYCDAYNKIRKI
jgi:hypothetical protein